MIFIKNNALLLLALFSSSLAPVWASQTVTSTCQARFFINTGSVAISDPGTAVLNSLATQVTNFYTGVVFGPAYTNFQSMTTAVPGITLNADSVDLTVNMELIFNPTVPTSTEVVSTYSGVTTAQATDFIVNYVSTVCTGCIFDLGNINNLSTVCTASSPADPTTPPAADDTSVAPGCFSSDATVDVLGRGEVTMANLQVGEHVLTANGKY